jgi:hypothetical protein
VQMSNILSIVVNAFAFLGFKNEEHMLNILL